MADIRTLSELHVKLTHGQHALLMPHNPPEDGMAVLPNESDAPELVANIEILRPTCVLLHSGQTMSLVLVEARTSFSKVVSQSAHAYS